VVANSAGRHLRASISSVIEFNIMKTSASCGWSAAAVRQKMLQQIAGSDSLQKRMAVEMENA